MANLQSNVAIVTGARGIGAGIAKALAKDGAKDIINYSSNKDDAENVVREILKHTPLGRIDQPSDIAPLVAFLVSEDSSWITGESIYVSGGYR
jgi:NAD(P)-dependent dehydrogenase (short-subunit alcohol dehydrogenase family)